MPRSRNRDQRNRDAERTGQHPELPRIRVKPGGTWECRVCHYKPLDRRTRSCVNCGRDWYGNPGIVPDNEDKPVRAGIRQGISSRPDPPE